MPSSLSQPAYVAVKGRYALSSDSDRLQTDRVLRELQASYWGARTTAESLARCIRHSLCFGLYDEPDQIGFARVITDFTTFAWLTDVYIEAAHRGQGLGGWFIEQILAHPDLQGLRRMALRTRDAHALYARFGFTELTDPDRWMTRS